jgi:hypothetical protein
MSEKLEALLQAVIDAETDTSYHYASESLTEAAPEILALIKARTPAPEGVTSCIELALVDHLRSLGCVCPKPLVGYRPNAGPRCRLCNVEPASPVVPVGVSREEIVRVIEGACLDYQRGHTGKVATRPERRARAVSDAADAIIAALRFTDTGRE